MQEAESIAHVMLTVASKTEGDNGPKAALAKHLYSGYLGARFEHARDHLTQEQGAAMERVANALANEAADHPM